MTKPLELLILLGLGVSVLVLIRVLMYVNHKAAQAIQAKNVVELDSYRPHRAGKAQCDRCFYVWAAVVPVSYEGKLQCPHCKKMEGVWC